MQTFASSVQTHVRLMLGLCPPPYAQFPRHPAKHCSRTVKRYQLYAEPPSEPTAYYLECLVRQTVTADHMSRLTLGVVAHGKTVAYIVLNLLGSRETCLDTQTRQTKQQLPYLSYSCKLDISRIAYSPTLASASAADKHNLNRRS